MIRRAHRTIVARVVAVCLLALTASPLTAPFSAVDSSDFGHSQPVDAHHPARDMAEAHLKVTPHLVVTGPDLAPVPVAADDDGERGGLRPALLVTTPRALSVVLRL